MVIKKTPAELIVEEEKSLPTVRDRKSVAPSMMTQHSSFTPRVSRVSKRLTTPPRNRSVAGQKVEIDEMGISIFSMDPAKNAFKRAAEADEIKGWTPRNGSINLKLNIPMSPPINMPPFSPPTSPPFISKRKTTVREEP
jgi:hypothetical protein